MHQIWRMWQDVIFTADKICCEYRISRSRKVADFVMCLCVFYYTSGEEADQCGKRPVDFSEGQGVYLQYVQVGRIITHKNISPERFGGRVCGVQGRMGMLRQDIFAWVKKQYHTEPDYPWNDGNAVLRHKENNKWFALIMEVGCDRLGLTGNEAVDVINVKCEPLLIGSLREKAGFHPAYHMNKDKWITARLDGSVPEDEIKSLIDLSFRLTGPKRKGGGQRDEKA